MINYVYKLANTGVGSKNPVRVMGIINTSPESFHKKSIKTSKKDIRDIAKKMEIDGADFIDVGGMSTAPYLKTIISEKIESQRITDAVKTIQNSTNLPISVDTCRSQVAKNALELGVEIINDISGLKYDSKMQQIVSKYEPSLILCAFSRKIVTGNHITSTKKLLCQSLDLAKKSGISPSKIVLDPSIGFFRRTGSGPFFTKIKSKWYDRDLFIIKNLKKLKSKNPILVSVSNKSFIGRLLDKENSTDRLFGSLAAEAISVVNGADIIRTHNVFETRDVVRIVSKLRN